MGNHLKVLLVTALPILIYFHFRGVIIHDEGYILNSAKKILEGFVPYRDFHFSYTPLSIFVTALTFTFLGESVLASRVLMLFLSLVSVVLIFKISQASTNRNIYGIFSSLIYIAWGPSHINFAWPVMFVLPLTLLTTYLILIFDKYKFSVLPFLIGIISFSVFLSKQNFGIIILPVLVYFLTLRARSFINIANLIYGFLWGIIIFCAYLILTDSFQSFVYDFYTFTIRKVLYDDALTTPILFIDTPIQTFGRALFYFILPILSLASIAILMYRKKFKLIFIPVLTLSYYFVGIRPTSDYVHLAPLLSLIGLPIVIAINKLPTLQVKILGYTILVVLIAVGFQTALFKGHYRWDIPLSQNNTYVGERVSIFTNQNFATQHLKIKKILNKYTKSEDYIFVDTYSPLLYFIHDRKNPTPFDFPGFEKSEIYQEIAIYSLVGKEVKIVFLLPSSIKSPLQSFVVKNYYFLEQIDDYYIYIKP